MIEKPSKGNRLAETTSRRGLLRGSAALSAAAALAATSGIRVAVPETAQAQTASPLASWNDGPAKKAIIDFVRDTTDPSSKNFVPPEERIATFDQDGTLWGAPDLQPVGLLPRPRARHSQREAGIGPGRAVQDCTHWRFRENR